MLLAVESSDYCGLAIPLPCVAPDDTAGLPEMVQQFAAATLGSHTAIARSVKRVEKAALLVYRQLSDNFADYRTKTSS